MNYNYIFITIMMVK